MIIRSAWRGEARKASKPKRAMSMRELTAAIISIAQQARPNVAGMNALPRAQLAALSSVVVSRRSSTCLSSSAPSSSPLEHRAGAAAGASGTRRCRRCRAAGGYLHSRAPLSPHVDEGHEQQHDEDDDLHQGERPERLQLDRHREQEDRLDVEQDEQHRDEVEGDAEAQRLLDLRRQAALVRIRRRLAPEARLGPEDALSVAKTSPRPAPRTTKTIAGRYARITSRICSTLCGGVT